MALSGLRSSASAVLTVLCIVSHSAWAEEARSLVTTTDSRVVYAPAFFSRYAPQTAGDMVRQIPGFTLIGGNRNGNNQDDVRGLGQGSGNLLLNGKRVSSKDSGPLELLARIPAENIKHIEILTQGSTELAGQSGLIVNVVYQETDKASGSWTGKVHVLEDGTKDLGAELSLAGKLSGLGFSASINRYNDEFPSWGVEEAFDGESVLWELRDETTNYAERGLELGLGVSWQGDAGQTANLNLSSANVNSTYREGSERFEPPGGQDVFGDLSSTVLFASREENNQREIGADYSKKFSVGTWKIIGLRRYEEYFPNNQFDEIETVGDHYSFQSQTESKETEAVIRTLFTIEPAKNHALEFALEGVKNTLKTSTRYAEDTGGGYAFFDVAGSDVDVNEDRAEISVQYSRPLRQGWSLQSLVASEYSKISVDAENEDLKRSDSFVRYKGFIALNGMISEKSTIRTRLEKTVGQLSFSDFASSKNVNEGTNDGGNTELVPDQTWRVELAYERSFGETDIFTVTAFVEQIEDFISFVPLGDGAESRGNLDQLDRVGIDISATVALDRFGIKGAKLDLLGRFHESRVDDPVTGGEMNFRENGHRPVYYRVSFRQDIASTDIAWGIEIEENSGERRYRLDQISVNDHLWPLAHRLFVEHKNIAGMTGKVEVEDFFGFTYVNSRSFYDGDRNGALSGRESNRRDSPWILRLSLTGNF